MHIKCHHNCACRCRRPYRCYAIHQSKCLKSQIYFLPGFSDHSMILYSRYALGGVVQTGNIKQHDKDRLLTHWGRVTHICVGKLTSIGSDNGLSPGRRQAIIWSNDGILLIGPLGTNFSEILIGIQTFSFKKMPLKMSSAKWRPFCLGLNGLIRAPNVMWWNPHNCGIQWTPVDYPYKDQLMLSYVFVFAVVGLNWLLKPQAAGDLRHHDAHVTSPQ